MLFFRGRPFQVVLLSLGNMHIYSNCKCFDSKHKWILKMCSVWKGQSIWKSFQWLELLKMRIQVTASIYSYQHGSTKELWSSDQSSPTSQKNKSPENGGHNENLMQFISTSKVLRSRRTALSVRCGLIHEMNGIHSKKTTDYWIKFYD